MYSDTDAAALYDVLNPWDPATWPSDAFYHGLVMAAGSVLDVGCGTGLMLHRARDLGHDGRLVGLDQTAPRWTELGAALTSNGYWAPQRTHTGAENLSWRR